MKLAAFFILALSTTAGAATITVTITGTTGEIHVEKALSSDIAHTSSSRPATRSC